MMLEKDIIKEAVRREWDKLAISEKYLGRNSEVVKKQRIKWCTLDELWHTLYDEEY